MTDVWQNFYGKIIKLNIVMSILTFVLIYYGFLGTWKEGIVLKINFSSEVFKDEHELGILEHQSNVFTMLLVFLSLYLFIYLFIWGQDLSIIGYMDFNETLYLSC